MAKYIKKRKRPSFAKKQRKDKKDQEKAAEYVSYLLELNKLQGIILNRLSREVK